MSAQDPPDPTSPERPHWALPAPKVAQGADPRAESGPVARFPASAGEISLPQDYFPGTPPLPGDRNPPSPGIDLLQLKPWPEDLPDTVEGWPTTRTVWRHDPNDDLEAPAGAVLHDPLVERAEERT
jgi:hypothetical protein